MRQAKARRMKIIGTIVVVVVVASGGSALAFAMDGSGKKKDSASSTPSTTPTPAPSISVKPGECGYQPLSGQAAQSAKNVGRPPAKPVTGTYEMTIDTSL